MIVFGDVLEKAVFYNPNLNQERLTKAFEYAQKIHDNQYRLSGDLYETRLLEVANILLPLKPDEDTLIACFLHGICNTELYNEQDVKTLFGKEVYFLVKTIASLRRIRSREQNTEVEVVRKMFLAMAQDVRVVLIKISERLHDMKMLSYRSCIKQKQIAKETLDVYVPISARLGIYNLKGQLEDSAFKYLYPTQYGLIKSDLEDYMAERESNIDDIKKELKTFLEKRGIEGVIEGRVKNLYSIYRKLKLKTRSTVKDLYDVYAIRVILPTRYDANNEMINDHLYAFLGLIHNKWKPLSNRFRDYVAMPKPNGYQSLHTAVIGLSPKSSQATEIQIRSHRMHEEAEYGIASHWIYDHSNKGVNQYSLDDHDNWLKVLSTFQQDLKKNDKDGKDLFDALKTDIFGDRIFVMTPSGDVKDLPKGSTPVDFAYAVHTDIGHRCQLAKVNDSVVSLDYELENGEIVEIVLGKNQDPKPAWLSFVKTSVAKTKIRSFFRSMDKEKSFIEGKEKFNKCLIKLNEPVLDDNLSVLKNYNGQRLSVKDRIGLIEEIGNGSVLLPSIIKKLFGKRLSVTKNASLMKRSRSRIALPKKRVSSKPTTIYIAGEKDLPYKFCSSCKPVIGLPIVGYITRGHSVTIHLQKCKLLVNAREERILDASWRKRSSSKRYPVAITVVANDRVGLIRDISNVIADLNANIVSFYEGKRVHDVIYREIITEVSSDDQLKQMFNRLERIRNVLEVKRCKPS